MTDTKQHWEYTTKFKNGWKLKVEFVKKVDGIWSSITDYKITEDEIKQTHNAIHAITDLFGLPNKGDLVDDGIEMNRVVERYFDAKEKSVSISLS